MFTKFAVAALVACSAAAAEWRQYPQRSYSSSPYSSRSASTGFGRIGRMGGQSYGSSFAAPGGSSPYRGASSYGGSRYQPRGPTGGYSARAAPQGET